MNTWNLPFSSLKNPKVDSLKCYSDSVATWIFTVTQESQSNKNALSSRQGKLTKVIERRFHECKGTFGDLLFQGRGESWICIALDTRLPWVIMYLLFKLAKYNFVQKNHLSCSLWSWKIAVLKVKTYHCGTLSLYEMKNTVVMWQRQQCFQLLLFIISYLLAQTCSHASMKTYTCNC